MPSMNSRSLQPRSSSSSSNGLAAKCSSWRHRLHTCSRQTAAPQVAATAAAAADNDSVVSSSRSSPCTGALAIRTAAAATAAAAAGPAAAVLPAVGAEVEVHCERLGVGGVGVCLLGPSRLVLLVRGALPGEALAARLTAVKKGYAEGIKLRSLSPHDSPALPACQHYGTCGGCTLQAMEYSTQLHHKTLHIQQLLQRVGKFSYQAVQAARLEPVAAEAGGQYRYRNKVQLAFSSKVWVEDDAAASRNRSAAEGWAAAAAAEGLQARSETAAAAAAEGLQADTHSAAAAAAAGVVRPGRVTDGWDLGFYLPGSNSVVMPVQQCSLVTLQVNQLIAAVAKLCQQQQLQPHNAGTGSGVLKHLIIRCSSAKPAAAAAADVGPTAAPTAVGVEPWSAAAGIEPAAAAVAGPQQLMAVFVTTSGCQSAALQPLAAALMAAVPGLVSVVHSIEAKAGASPTGAAAAQQDDIAPASSFRSGGDTSNTASLAGRQQTGASTEKQKHQKMQKRGGRQANKQQQQQQRGAQALAVASSTVLAGVPYLVETLSGLQFHVSPHSFFQTNTRQAELLYDEVLQAVQQYYAAADCAEEEAASIASSSITVLQQQPAQVSRTVLDLYCGTGTISLLLASRLAGACKRVVGFDVSAFAIADARANAARNGIANVQFVCGDLTQLAQGELLGPESPDSSSSSNSSKSNGSIESLIASSSSSSSSSSKAWGSPDSLIGKPQACRPGVVVDAARPGLSSSSTAGSSGGGSPDSIAHPQAGQPDVVVGDSARAGLSSSSSSSGNGSPDSIASWIHNPQACQPDVVVVDPARAGLSRSVVDYVLRCGAQRVVYVSCNAATQARDLQLLCGGAAVGAAAAGGGWGGGAVGRFRLVSWRGVDMFPQTDHLETVVVLDRC